jgi:Protein of unknown function (DUF726)
MKTELAMLLLLCTDAMRKELAATFELTSADAASPATSHVDDLISADQALETQSVAAETQRQRSRESRERELATSQMQGLRRAALTYFDAWRAKVLRRICDVLGIRPELVRQARKAHVAEREAAKRLVKDQAFLDWAYGEDGHSEKQPKARYPPVPTKLASLDKEKRVLLVNCVLLILLSLESYPAHSRVLLLHVAFSLLLDLNVLVEQENRTAQGLLQAASQMSAEEARKKAQDDSSRRWKVGLATVGGAALLAVTGGLAAPLLAAGIGSVLGGIGLAGTAISGLLGTLAGSSVLIGGLFGAYGGKMTGKMMDRYAKDVEDFKFIPVRATNVEDDPWNLGVSSSKDQQHKLRVAIAVSGVITVPDDFELPWTVIDRTSCEPFALRWELDTLVRLGVSLSSVLKTYVWRYAKFELVRRTIFATLAMGLWPLGLLEVARVADNPFSVAKARADKAGKVLAHAIISRAQGERPVTLIGYSIGARLIYSTLLELAEQNAFGLVENVILMGVPAPSEPEPWTKIRAMVSDRVVNVHCERDFILGFLYRASSLQFGISGLQPVEHVNGVENFDASDIVDGHTNYRYAVGQILQLVGFDDINPEEVEKEVEVLKAIKIKEEMEKKEYEKKSKADVKAERAQVEASIKGVASGQIVMADVDEKEEMRKQQLIEIAGEREKGSEEWKPREGLQITRVKQDTNIDFFACLEPQSVAGVPVIEVKKATVAATTEARFIPTKTRAIPAFPDTSLPPLPAGPKEQTFPLPVEKQTTTVSVVEHAIVPTTGAVLPLVARPEELKIVPRIEIEDLGSEEEYESDEAPAEMTFLEPEAIPDDDEPEQELVQFGEGSMQLEWERP